MARSESGIIANNVLRSIKVVILGMLSVQIIRLFFFKVGDLFRDQYSDHLPLEDNDPTDGRFFIHFDNAIWPVRVESLEVLFALFDD